MKMPPQMKGTKFRLSPNEEARILKEEKEKRRKLRIVQVREQAKANAARIRTAVKNEQDKQLHHLACKLKSVWENEQEQKLQQLERQYESSVRAVGEGHYEANQPDTRSELREALLKEDKRRAEERFRIAMEKLKEETSQKELKENHHIISRKVALERERLRANQIAALPPPPPDPLINIEPAKTKPVQIVDVDAFSSTYFHISEGYGVDRALPHEQIDARSAAKEEAERTEELEAEMKRAEHERMEKARLRHKHARHKELLKQDYDKMLLDLSDLQRADWHRRQQIVANIPKNVFQPPHKRMEDSEEKQMTLEHAFEDMYMASTDYMGDTTLALDPHPEPDTPAASDVLDLSYDEDLNRPPRKVTAGKGASASVFRDVTNQKTPEKKKAIIDTKKSPDSGLRRLLGKIKSQRDDWASQTSQDVLHVDGPSEPGHIPPEVVLAPQRAHYQPDDVSSVTTSVKSSSQHTVTDTSESLRSTEVTGSSSPASMPEKSLSNHTTETSTTENLERFCRIYSDTESDRLSERPAVDTSPVDLNRFQKPSERKEDFVCSSDQSVEESIITGSPTLYHPIEEAARTRRKTVEQHYDQREPSKRRSEAFRNADDNEQQEQLRSQQEVLTQQKTDLESRIQSILTRRRQLEEQLTRSQLAYQTQLMASAAPATAATSVVSVAQSTPGASAQAIRQRLQDIDRQAAAIRPMSVDDQYSAVPAAQMKTSVSAASSADSQTQSGIYVSDCLSSTAGSLPGARDPSVGPLGSSLPSLAESRLAIANIERQRAKIEEYRRRLQERKPIDFSVTQAPDGSGTAVGRDPPAEHGPDRLAYMSSRVRELHQQSADLLDEFSVSSGLQDSDDSKHEAQAEELHPNDEDVRKHLRYAHVESVDPAIASERVSGIQHDARVLTQSVRGSAPFTVPDKTEPATLLRSDPLLQQSQLDKNEYSYPAQPSVGYHTPIRTTADHITDASLSEMSQTATALSSRDPFLESQQSFERRQEQLEEQLEEIRRQKDEILARQQQQQEKVQQLRENWVKELAPYKVSGTSVQPGDTAQSGHTQPSSIEDEQLVALFNRVMVGKKESPQTQEVVFTDFRPPMSSKPPPPQVVFPDGHVPHELSAIAEADTPSSTGRSSLRPSQLQTPLEIISENSTSAGLIGESPYLQHKNATENVTEPSQVKLPGEALKPAVSTGFRDVQQMYTDLPRFADDVGKSIFAHPGVRIGQDMDNNTMNTSYIGQEYLSPPLSTGPLETEEYHPDLAGITISSDVGDPDQSESHENQQVTVEEDTTFKSLDKQSTSRSFDTHTSDSYIPIILNSAKSEAVDDSLGQPNMLSMQSSDYDASLLNRFVEPPAESTSSISGITPTDISQYPISGITYTSRSRISDSSPDLKERFAELELDTSGSEMNGQGVTSDDISQYPITEDNGKSEQFSQSLSQAPFGAGFPREPERVISATEIPRDSLIIPDTSVPEEKYRTFERIPVSEGGWSGADMTPQTFSNGAEVDEAVELSQYPVTPAEFYTEMSQQLQLDSQTGATTDAQYKMEINSSPSSASHQTQVTTKQFSQLSQGALFDGGQSFGHSALMSGNNEYGQFMPLMETQSSVDPSPVTNRWSSLSYGQIGHAELNGVALDEHSRGSSDAEANNHFMEMISDTDTGITDEPDLTLISAASQTPMKFRSEMTLEDPSDVMSTSLMSFEKHEVSVRSDATNHSPVKGVSSGRKQGQTHTPVSDVISTEDDSSSFGHMLEDISQDTSSGGEAGLSLQEAFMQKKRGFIKSSEKRQGEVKSGQSTRGQHGQLNKVLASWKNSRGMKTSGKPEKSNLKMVDRTSEQRKKTEKEMYERNKRLYNNLEEVKVQKLEKKRQQDYAANREKAKEYHRQLQEKRKKKAAKKEQ